MSDPMNVGPEDVDHAIKRAEAESSGYSANSLPAELERKVTEMRDELAREVAAIDLRQKVKRMSSTRSVTIHCEAPRKASGCLGDTGDLGTDLILRARAAAKLVGWRRTLARDYCPPCWLVLQEALIASIRRPNRRVNVATTEQVP